jgi:hypothetical protein
MRCRGITEYLSSILNKDFDKISPVLESENSRGELQRQGQVEPAAPEITNSMNLSERLRGLSIRLF